MKLRYFLFHILMCLALAFVVPSCVDPVEDPEEIVDEEEDEYEDEEGEYDGDVLYEEALDNICEFVNDLYLESSTLKELADHSKSIKKIKGVAKVYTSDIALFVETVHGAKLSWTYFPVPEVRSSDDYQVTLITEEGLETKSEVSLYEIVPEYEDVCIFFQMCDDERYEDLLSEYEELADRLEDCGAYVDMVYDFDIEFLQESITEYDVVILVTSGFYEKDINGEYKHWIMLSEDGEDYLYETGEDVSSDVICGYVKEYWRGEADYYGYLMVSEDFLEENIKGSFDETSLIFNTAGESLKTDPGLSDMFESKGAGAYVGYENAGMDIASEKTFFEGLMQGGSVSETLAVVDLLTSSISKGDDVKIVDEVEGEEIYVYIKTNIDSIFLECDSLAELEDRLDEISQIEGVEAAYVSGNALCVKFEGGRLASWIMFPDPAEDEETKSSSTTLAEADISIRSNLSACIILQVSNDEKFSDVVDKYYELEKDFKDKGVATRVVLAPEFTRSFVRTEMSSYDIVIMVTHGMWDVEGTDHKHGILLGEEFKYSMLSADDKIDSGYAEEKRNGKEGVTKEYVMVDEDYLDTALGNFKDNSIVFNVACASLKGNNKMAEMFKKKGVGAYLGYNDTNCKPLSPYYFFKNMLKGMTVQEALEAMRSDYKNDVHLDHPKVPHSAKLLNAISSGNDISISQPTLDKWVDLGLSVLWAAWNVDATSPEEYGGFYAWGETSTKSDYTWKNYKFYNPSTDGFDFIGSEISGTSYDVAHVQWGGGARMPTLAEVQELIDNCTFTKGSYNGVRGSYVTGPNGNSIFLPFAGHRYDGALYSEGVGGTFWSGTSYDDSLGYHACGLSCRGYYGDWYYSARYVGYPVRPVTEK